MARIWTQWGGFTTPTVAGTGCTATIDAANLNKLTATIASAADGSDTAVGETLVAGNLQSGAEGYERFHMTTPAALSLSNNSTFFVLKIGSVEIIDLYLDSALKPNVFGSTPLNGAGMNAVSSGAALSSSSEYIFEASYKQNVSFTLKQNGTTIIALSGFSGGVGTAIPTLRRHGIDHYDGASGTGWTNIITLAQSGDSLTDSFSDPFGTVRASNAIPFMSNGRI